MLGAVPLVSWALYTCMSVRRGVALASTGACRDDWIKFACWMVLRDTDIREVVIDKTGSCPFRILARGT